MDQRYEELQHFVRACLGNVASALEVVSGDASFRRYFRCRIADKSIIAVDAPPQRENVQAFLALADGLHRQGVAVPEVLFRAPEQGFWLLQDFGDRLLLAELNDDSADRLYALAIDELLRLQSVSSIDSYTLPLYDAAKLQTELQLFPDWFLRRHYRREPAADELALLQSVFALLIENAEQQPQVLVHRDYHARNLMLQDSGRLGVIDFQDAVHGPLTYDIVSLLKDCYIRWPRERQLHWLHRYAEQAVLAGSCQKVERAQLIRWFDLTGLQRHIKVLGIFCRLNYRDGKAAYLNDLPRVLDYCIEAASLYADTQALASWLQQDIAPLLNNDGRARL